MKRREDIGHENGAPQRQKLSHKDVLISNRAQTRALSPFNSYFQSINDGKKNAWSQDNPDGVLVVALAENNLCQEPLLEWLQAAHGEVQLPPRSLMYQDFVGTPELREAMAGFLNRTFMKGVGVQAEHLVISAGCGAIIDNLFYTICDPGEGVLIPAPYYPAFDNELSAKIDTCPVPVHLDLHQDLLPQLDAACQASQAKGVAIKALLLTNPNNPLGTIYPTPLLLAMLRWCLARGIHCVSDEIYALSVWGEDAVFESMENVALQLSGEEREAAGRLLHTIFGLSKDFGASGLRIGALHTRHPTIMAVLHNVAYFCAVPNITQLLVTQLLQDTAFVDAYVQENKQRMRASYRGLEKVLKAGGIPHTEPNSAMFCWMDLRELLPEDSWEGEQQLWHRLKDEKNIILTPGQFCHAVAPGFFRCCWAWVPAEGLLEVGKRLVALKNEGQSKK